MHIKTTTLGNNNISPTEAAPPNLQLQPWLVLKSPGGRGEHRFANLNSTKQCNISSWGCCFHPLFTLPFHSSLSTFSHTVQEIPPLPTSLRFSREAFQGGVQVAAERMKGQETFILSTSWSYFRIQGSVSLNHIFLRSILIIFS